MTGEELQASFERAIHEGTDLSEVAGGALIARMEEACRLQKVTKSTSVLAAYLMVAIVDTPGLSEETGVMLFRMCHRLVREMLPETATEGGHVRR